MAPINIEKVIAPLDWSAYTIRDLLFGQVFKGDELDFTSLLSFFAVFHLINELWKVIIPRVLPKSSEKMKLYGGNQFVSILMSIFVCTRGVLLLYGMLDRSPSFQYLSASTSSKGTTLSPDPYIADLEWRFLTHMAHTNEMFLSYALFDTFWQLFKFGEYGSLDMVMHHAAFIAVSVCCHKYMVFLIMFAVLAQGEWSTIFLNTRWMQRETGRNTDLTSYLFAVSFFVTRVIVYGYGMVHLFLEYPGLEAESTVPTAYFRLFTAALAAMFFLNIYWFNLIVRIAMKKKSKNPPDAKVDEKWE